MLTSVAGGVGKVGKAAKAIPGASLVEAGSMVLNTFLTAETQDEKAQGYGEAAGTLAGTMAGAAAGAAIGSVVPIIGTAIGGMVGAYLGSMGGQQLGGWAGLSMFGSDKTEATAAPITPMLMASRPGPAVPSLATMANSFAARQPAVVATQPAPAVQDIGTAVAPLSPVAKPLIQAVPVPVNSIAAPPVRQQALFATAKPRPTVPMMMPIGPALGDVTRSLAAPVAPKPANLVIQAPAAPKSEPARVDQKFSYSLNMPVTVEGDAKDPQQFVQQLLPLMQRALNDAAQQEARRNLYDDAHT